MAGKKKTQEVAIVPNEVSLSELQTVMIAEAGKRDLITKYISHHMKVGVDYGTIKIGGRDSKPSLFKPGSEKFLSLFKLTATFRKDSDTWEMAGKTEGLFCYVCEIKTNKGDIVGEGRGTSNLKEKNNWTVNNAVKIAEKRAQIDAVLRMGALSDFFTQDLEDMKFDTEPVKDDAPVIVMGADDEDQSPLPLTPKEQRVRLANILKYHKVDIADKKAAEQFVADRTQLALVEGNFGEIIRMLEEQDKKN